MKKDNSDEYDRAFANNAYDVSSVYDHIIRIRQRYFGDLRGNALDHGFGNGMISEYLAREGFETYGLESSAMYRFRDKADLANSFDNAGFIIDDLGIFDFKLLDVSSAKHYIVLARKP